MDKRRALNATYLASKTQRDLSICLPPNTGYFLFIPAYLFPLTHHPVLNHTIPKCLNRMNGFQCSPVWLTNEWVAKKVKGRRRFQEECLSHWCSCGLPIGRLLPYSKVYRASVKLTSSAGTATISGFVKLIFSCTPSDVEVQWFPLCITRRCFHVLCWFSFSVLPRDL